MPAKVDSMVVSLARSLGPFREHWSACQSTLRLLALVSPT